MKNKVVALAGISITLVVMLTCPVLAAELLDVKPIVVGADVVIEVTADIPMTYTYYKVPGQARAVVDIADADPEKVEPLIVVNKGAVSSISVDKAMIGDMTVSRLVFNLVTMTDVSVSQGPDRKTLTVSFGNGKPVATQPTIAPSAPVAVAVAVTEPVVPPLHATAAEAPSSVAVSSPITKEEEDLLGLDDPEPAVASAAIVAAPAVRSAKLKPVVPVSSVHSPATNLVVKGVVIGASFIEIQTDNPVAAFKQLQLSKPARLSLDIPGTSSVKVTSIQVNRFGIAKVRIGANSGSVRVVLDAAKPFFPKYEIVTVDNGLRVNFK